MTRWTTRQPDAGTAVLAYGVLAVGLTWPLAAGLGRDVPGDLGDSLLNMWILAWGARHIPALLAGAMDWTAFWNANIFHPEPLALAYSEHLVGQSLQILPVYWTTGNIILCYNLLFLSTFALSALGAYLLVRDLTGDRRAAFVAGLVFGFLPYRIASLPHLQVLSAQWMPLALFGLHRFVVTGSLWALAGGAGALVMQNWSCGYYLLYFGPFVPLFVVHRLWALGRLGDKRAWLALAGAGLVTLAATVPFLLPYLDAQRRFGFERPYGEVVAFSANVWSYATAAEPLRLFGRALRFHPHGEGEAFLGIVPWVLAVVALFASGRSHDPGETPSSSAPGARSRLSRAAAWIAVLLVAALALQAAACAAAIISGGFEWRVLGVTVRGRTLQRMIAQIAVTLLLLLVVSRRARTTAAAIARSPVAFFAVALGLAMWLSLGPAPAAGPTPLSGFGLYAVLYEHVPGFDGVRVPARYAMIAGLFLAVLAGYGAAALVRRRAGALVVAVAAALVLVEGAAVPLDLNGTWAQNEALPPARVSPAGQAPPVYDRVRALPPGSVIAEFPFGDAAWEIRYVYYSAAHWKPIINGYSGSFPRAYQARVARLGRVAEGPDAAWQALVDSGATHVVVHDAAFADPNRAAAIRRWLLSRGATLVDSLADGDHLYNLRPRLRM